MNISTKQLFIGIMIVFLQWSFFVQARIVTPDQALYQEYEKLLSCSKQDKAFYGQGLWTEKQIRSFIQRIDSLELSKYCAPDIIQPHIDRLHALLKKSDENIKKPHIDLIESAALKYLFISNDDSLYPRNNSGLFDAIANTFREDKEGTVLGIGNNFSLWTTHFVSWQNQELFINPRIDFLVRDNFSSYDDTRLTLHQGYLLLDFWKLTASIGRSPVIWGQGKHGGLLFSQNPRPLDHFQLTNSEPFRLPWIFSKLGQWKLSYIFGNLGPEQYYPWSYFTGLAIGYKPVKNFEVNLSHVMQFGGTGSPSLSVKTGAQEFFGFIPFISQSSKGGSNKLTALDARFFVPQWMGLQGYFEYQMDDSTISSFRMLKRHFTYNSSYQAGIYFPRFLNSFKDSFRFEYTSTAPITYRHSQFRNGWTANNQIIGHSLGPDAQRFYFSYQHEWSSKTASNLDVLLSKRSGDTYQIVNNGADINVTNDLPDESRFTFIWNQIYNLNQFQFDASLGYEYIHNKHFTASNGSHSFLFSLAVKYLF